MCKALCSFPGPCKDVAVVAIYSCAKLPCALLGILPEGAFAHIAVAQKGNCADNEGRCAFFVVKDEDFPLDCAVFCAAQDVDAVVGKVARGRVQVGGGIVVAAGDDYVAAGGIVQGAQKVEVDCHCPVGGRGGVEDVAACEQDIHPFLPYGVGKPGKEGLVFVKTALFAQVCSDMPVGRVQDAHVLSFWIRA